MSAAKKAACRPYALSIEEHRELQRLKRSGKSIAELSVEFGVDQNTVYRYVRLAPEKRRDYEAGA